MSSPFLFLPTLLLDRIVTSVAQVDDWASPLTVCVQPGSQLLRVYQIDVGKRLEALFKSG